MDRLASPPAAERAVAPAPAAPSPAVKVRVAICIATYRRGQQLRALLDSLDAQVFDGPAPEIRLIVVDNDAETPLDGLYGPIQSWTKYPLTYVVEPIRGVVAARNRALSLIPDDTDFIAFVDDDEQAVPKWLASLLATQAETGAVAVQGTVLPDYESEPPAWIADGQFFQLGPYEEGQDLGHFAATNNVLVSKDAVDALSLRFDMRFNLTGGEDQDFFDRLSSQSGGKIVASKGAVVRDAIPVVRMTLTWLLRRWYRIGQTLGVMSLLRRQGRGLRLIKGLCWVVYGLARAVIAAPFSRTEAARALARMAFGMGTVSAFLRIEFKEYSDKAVDAERNATANRQ